MPNARTHAEIIIGHHLIFSGYGFWLANDPRGSGSKVLREPKFEDLGPIHPGRKHEQPTRAMLRAFYEKATPLLDFTPLWFNEEICGVIAESFSETTKQYRYTVWAMAVMPNHAHICVRQHLDAYQAIWERFAMPARDAVRNLGRTADGHPIWANRPYSVYLYSPADVGRTIDYIQKNPLKDGLPEQQYACTISYSGWPFPNDPRRWGDVT